MRGEGNPFGKGFSLSPHAPLSLPKTFVPVSGRWRSATGGRRWAVSRRAWGRTVRSVWFKHKKRPVVSTGRFCIHRARGRAGLASFTACHAIHLGRWRADIQGQDDAGYFVACKNVQTRGARSGTDRAPLVWRPRIRRRGPACRSKEEVLEGRGEGEPFLEKVFLPRRLACAFYSWARPMPGRAASRPAPRRKRPASSKALPMSCMPTGILLSAAMPTGRDRPGRPARFRDRV